VDAPSNAPASRKTARSRALGAYLAAVLLPLAAAVLLLGIRPSDLRAPFSYHGDAVSFAFLVKSIVDHGWYRSNRH
jgi:hypothetical protein